MRISDWSSDVCSSDLSVPPEEIRRINAVMTMVGGQVVYGEEDFADLAPPLPPASHSWAPVVAFASPGMRTASVQPSVQHARSCQDRKSVVWGKRVSVRVDLGGRRFIKKKIVAQYCA